MFLSGPKLLDNQSSIDGLGGQKAPNWTSETGGGEADFGGDNLPQ